MTSYSGYKKDGYLRLVWNGQVLYHICVLFLGETSGLTALLFLSTRTKVHLDREDMSWVFQDRFIQKKELHPLQKSHLIIPSFAFSCTHVN